MKKKNSPIKNLIVFLLCAIIMVVGFFVTLSENFDIIMNNPTDFYELQTNNQLSTGKYVSLDVDAVLENYAKTKHSVSFIPTGTDQHYILWLGDGSVISLTTNDKKLIKKFDAMIDETWNYIDELYNENYDADLPEAVEVKGKITSIRPKISGFYEEFLGEMGVTSEFTVYHMTIDTTETPFKNIMLLIAMVVFLVISILVVISNIKVIKASKDNAVLQPIQSQTNSDYQPMGGFGNQPQSNMNYGETGSTYGTYQQMKEEEEKNSDMFK